MAKRRIGPTPEPNPGEAAPPDTPGPDPSPNGTDPPPPLPNERRPTFKVGPIACDRNTTVEAAVWANEVTLNDGRTFTVHNVTLHGRWRDERTGEWKDGKSYRGSHLHVLIYCLQRCNDWILAQRDQAGCPF